MSRRCATGSPPSCGSASPAGARPSRSPADAPYSRRVTFDVAADSYVRFMGQFSVPLAAKFVDVLDLHEGQRALDVGCGPGMLTSELVDRLGAEAVSAVDPSPSFAAAASEVLPFADQAFDRTLAQLVVHFMSDPVAGLREMRRVTRPGGLVAASVWDHA